MPQVKVQAVTGFEHNGTRNRGDTFVVSDQHAHALQARGLVKIVNATDEAEQAKAATEAAHEAVTSTQTTRRRRRGAQPEEPKAEKLEGAAGDKTATGSEASNDGFVSASGENQPETQQDQAQPATDGVAAASDAKTE